MNKSNNSVKSPRHSRLTLVERFDPSNPTDAQRALADWEREIDLQFTHYRDNPFIECLRLEVKKALYEWIDARVAEAQKKLLDET
jgi:hypothetical protein